MSSRMASHKLFRKYGKVWRRIQNEKDATD